MKFKKDLRSFLKIKGKNLQSFVRKKYDFFDWKYYYNKRDIMYFFNDKPRILFVCELDFNKKNNELSENGTDWFGKDILNRASVLSLLNVLKEVNDVRFGVVLVNKDFKDFSDFVKSYKDLELVVSVKPSNLNLVTSVKGVLDVGFNVKSKSFNALSDPEHDLIFRLNDFFKTVSDFDLWNEEHYEQGKNFFNLLSLDSSSVPPKGASELKGVLRVSYNFLRKGEEVFNKFKAISTDYRSFKLLNNMNPYVTDTEEFWFKKLKSSVNKHFITILRSGNHSGFEKFYNDIGVNTVQFGLSGGSKGLNNEFLDYTSVNKFKKIIKSFLN